MAFRSRFEGREAGESDNPLELRSTPRVATSLPAEVTLGRMPGPLKCRLRDVGTGGVCIQTPSHFPLDSLRRITMHLSGESLTLDVEGCWQRETLLENAVLTGAKFLDLEAGQAKRIREFVHERASELTRFLQESSEFAGLGLDEALDAALFSRIREAPPGTYISREGHLRFGEDSIFVVMRGRVILQAGGARAHELELESIGPGGVFGGLPLIADVPPPLSAVAAREVTLLELDRSALRYLERAKPLVADRISRVVIAKNVAHLRAAVGRLVSASRPAGPAASGGEAA